jgi:uncharacterized membrane protein
MISNMTTTNPNKRLLSIDFARGLAVFFMIAVHTLEVFANQEVKNSLFGQIISFLGGPPAAPVFMTLMGFSFIYSSKSALKPKLLRGFKIFLSGYVLNILRGVIPYTLATHLKLDVIKIFPIEKINVYTILTTVDILQFAGIALMIMSIIQGLQINKYLILLSAFLISMISPLLWGIKLDIPIIDQLFELFWGDLPIEFGFIANKIAFPVFPWLTFPLLGMFLGETVKNSIDMNRIFNYFGLFGIFLIGIGVAISFSNYQYHFNDYYHSRQGAMVFMCGFVLSWLYLNKLVIDSVPKNSLFDLLFNWSKGVTNVYFVQWIIIIWSIAFIGINSSPFTTTILLILIFTGISHFTNELIIQIQKRFNIK